VWLALECGPRRGDIIMAKRRCRIGKIITWATALALLLGAAGGAGLRAGQNPAEAPANPSTTPSSPAQVPSRIDPKAQQVLDRVIRALGGPAFLKVKRLTTRGRIYSIRDEATSAFAPFESYVEYPDKRRFSYGKNPPVITSTMATTHGNWTGTDRLPSCRSRCGAGRYPIATRWRIFFVSASMIPECSFSRAVLTSWITWPHKVWTWRTRRELK
jgi:hypothetical protein